ncbi:MAG: plastocyanin/azurin family copper-binding protein, partial [Halapricum sp.]
MERRQYLQRAAGAASFGLIAATAGCGGDGGNGADTTEPSDDETTMDDDMTDDETTMDDGTTTDDGGMTTIDESTTVTIEGFAFSPVRASVDPGGTVEWINEDGAAHTVVASDLTGEGDDWSFDREVSGDGSVTHTFDSEGVYEYFCDIHGQSS